MLKALEWTGKELILIDQRKLPFAEEYIRVKTLEQGHAAIKDMVVRGAPAIGLTALYSMLLGLQEVSSFEEFENRGNFLKTARPTAVNLAFEVNRCLDMAKAYFKNRDSLFFELEKFIAKQQENLANANKKMSQIASEEFERLYGKRKLLLMTLCNTGVLACGTMGTALGVISHLHSLGRIEWVYASETRPFLQGSRLTAYELSMEKIPYSLVVEGAHAHLLKTQKIDGVVIGADRIVSNGDTANKVGSSNLAILCNHYKVPFYVVAPLSSFDFSKETGDSIEIEYRSDEEVLSFAGKRVAPMGATAFNPSFDITDHRLISGIICEKGLVRPQKRITSRFFKFVKFPISMVMLCCLKMVYSSILNAVYGWSTGPLDRPVMRGILI